MIDALPHLNVIGVIDAGPRRADGRDLPDVAKMRLIHLHLLLDMTLQRDNSMRHKNVSIEPSVESSVACIDISGDRFGLNAVGGWNKPEIEMFNASF
jgi:hypothetical protein